MDKTDDGFDAATFAQHFNQFGPEYGPHFKDIYRHMRAHCPVAHTDEVGGYWAWVGPKVVMLEKRKMLMDAETDRCIQLASGFLILAEKELSAFIRAVEKLFGAEQARQSALDWIEELGRMDWPSGESFPDWRRATVGASARLGALLSGSGHRDTLN